MISIVETAEREAVTAFDALFSRRESRSKQLFDRATGVLPGGVSSTARGTWQGWTPYPPFISHGTGSRIWDVDGHEYVDYLLGLGPMILGHRPAEVTAAVVQGIEALGTMFALPYELETVAARKVVEAVPSVDLVRFTNSGSEAVGTAVRLARAYTGRPLIVRFEGMYHGWMDTVYWSNHPAPASAGPQDRPTPIAAGPGVPAQLADTVIVLTWNDPDGIERVMRERGEEIAAIITEPALLNTGCILPQPGYLELLRRLTSETGSLLIFDEVITGFRLALGGGQEYYGVNPDLTTMAKAMAGGFPAAAIGGRREVMAMIAAGRYSHSGTYNSNVVAMAAVSATIDRLRQPGLYDCQRALGQRLMDALVRQADEVGLPVQGQGLGTAFQLWFSRQPIRNWRDAERWARPAVFRRWWEEMFLRGVLFHPSPYENLFISMAHTEGDVDRTLEASHEAFRVLASDEAVLAALETEPGWRRPGRR